MNAPQGAKSFSGLKGNLKFIFWYKMWATLIVLAVGVAIGAIFCASINSAVAHPGKSAKDGCHQGKADYRHKHWNAYISKGNYALVEVPCAKKEAPVVKEDDDCRTQAKVVWSYRFQKLTNSNWREWKTLAAACGFK